MSDHYSINRYTLIAAPADEVYARIVDLHRWREWSPWENVDPELNRDYSGPQSGVGARYAWMGNKKAGRGSMEIVAAAAPEGTAPGLVEVAVVFEKPMKSESTSSFRLETQGAVTRVDWTMTGKHSLFSRVAGPLGFFDKLLGKDFEKGLAQLKTASEAD